MFQLLSVRLDLIQKVHFKFCLVNSNQSIFYWVDQRTVISFYCDVFKKNSVYTESLYSCPFSENWFIKKYSKFDAVVFFGSHRKPSTNPML